MAPAGSDTENDQDKIPRKRDASGDGNLSYSNRLMSEFYALLVCHSDEVRRVVRVSAIRRTSRLPVWPNGVGEGRTRYDATDSNPKEV